LVVVAALPLTAASRSLGGGYVVATACLADGAERRRGGAMRETIRDRASMTAPTVMAA